MTDPHNDVQTRYAPTRRNWAGLIESFSIFGRYGEGEFRTGAEHDILYVYIDPAEVSEADTVRLSELGWEPSAPDNFYRNTSG